MTVIAEIREAWGWSGIEPEEVVATNEFGNLLVRDLGGSYWRICPEDVYCQVVARSEPEFQALLRDSEFVADWEMVDLAREARRVVGPLDGGRRYCLKIPGVLGGAYAAENLGSMHLNELIRFSGDVGRQIQDLPDGSEIELKVVD